MKSCKAEDILKLEDLTDEQKNALMLTKKLTTEKMNEIKAKNLSQTDLEVAQETLKNDHHERVFACLTPNQQARLR